MEWQQRSAWTSPHIKSEAINEQLTSLFITLFLALFTFFPAILIYFLVQDGYLIAAGIVSLLPLWLTYLLLKRILRIAQLLLQPPPALALAPYPGRIGGDVGGSIDTPLDYQESQRFQARLICKQWKRYNNRRSQAVEHTIWEQKLDLDTKPYYDAAGNAKSQVLIRYRVPIQLPESDAVRKRYYRYWLLEVWSDNGQFSQRYDIPVYKGKQLAANIADYSRVAPKPESPAVLREYHDHTTVINLPPEQSSATVNIQWKVSLGFTLLGLLMLALSPFSDIPWIQAIICTGFLGFGLSFLQSAHRQAKPWQVSINLHQLHSIERLGWWRRKQTTIECSQIQSFSCRPHTIVDHDSDNKELIKAGYHAICHHQGGETILGWSNHQRRIKTLVEQLNTSLNQGQQQGNTGE